MSSYGRRGLSCEDALREKEGVEPTPAYRVRNAENAIAEPGCVDVEGGRHRGEVGTRHTFERDLVQFIGAKHAIPEPAAARRRTTPVRQHAQRGQENRAVDWRLRVEPIADTPFRRGSSKGREQRTKTRLARRHTHSHAEREALMRRIQMRDRVKEERQSSVAGDDMLDERIRRVRVRADD